MNPIAVQCANCGAKYKLPETFAGDKAKCKACGSAIDVKSARSSSAGGSSAGGSSASSSSAGGASAAPTPAKVAPTTRPVVSHRQELHKHEEAEAKPASGLGSAHASSRRHGHEGGHAGADAGKGRHGATRHGPGHHGHGHGAEKKKGNPALVIGGIAGGVAIVGLVAWLVLGRKDADPKPTDTAGNTPAANTPSANDTKAAEAAKAEEAKKLAAAKKANDELAKFEQEKKEAAAKEKLAAAANAKKPESQTPEIAKAAGQETKEGQKDGEKPQEANATKGEKPRFAKKGLTSKDQVYDPKKELQPLVYEEGTTDDQKKEYEELVETVFNGGAVAKNKAKKKIAAAGYRAMTAVINRLREIDYLDSEQSMTAFELNKLLEEMTMGVNALFQPVNMGDTIDFDKADFNAKTVKAWQTFMTTQYPSSERFAEMLKARKTRNTEEAKKKDDGEGDK